MSLEIAPFAPVAADAQLIAECYQVSSAAFRTAFPDRPFSSYEAFSDRLLSPSCLMGPQRFWAARSDGHVVGIATVTLPEHENRDFALVDVRVDPVQHRQGIGRALLRGVLPLCRAEQRTALAAQGVMAGSAGERWALALGFVKVQEFVLQSLTVPDVDPRLWQVAAPAGFRVEQWTGSAPGSLVAPYARARTAIVDAPTGASEFHFPEWTVERVRRHEAELRERGDEQHVVVAVHEETGTVAGLTELMVSAARPTVGYQLDTAVLPAFRGRGLGRFVKARMMLVLTADRPELTRVAINTASDNGHMIRVNHQVGYRTDETVADLEACLDTLEAALSS
ncbi:GNAT family N-acetyltransferase [Streptomyces sp. NPDC001380]|uniref:GNAT family N-acetyltransferase n=1 Tax=Streptomyces sp. NPDC001380 TaxID=3364566 RepID=UPI0036750F85